MISEQIRVSSALNRTRKLSLPSTLTLREWHVTLADFGGMCAYCRCRPFDDLDHFVPVSKGGGSTASNVLPACEICNYRKHTKMPVEAAEVFGAGCIEALTAYLHGRSMGADVGEILRVEKEATKLDPPEAPSDDNTTVQFNVRVPKFLLKELDSWLADLNEGRRVGQINRSDLVRLVLDRACRERPDLDVK